MVRTKADAGVKVSGAKAPRKALPSTPTRTMSSDGGDSKSKQYVGGNSYHPRETPGWQKPITNFFNCPPSASKESDGTGSSKEQTSSSGSSSSETDK